MEARWFECPKCTSTLDMTRELANLSAIKSALAGDLLSVTCPGCGSTLTVRLVGMWLEGVSSPSASTKEAKQLALELYPYLRKLMSQRSG